MAPPAPTEPKRHSTELKRSVSLPLLVLYGLGTTVGAGIYVLIGEVAGLAGVLAPVAFLVAALLAAPTAFAFGELSARYPRSAGEAVYVSAGFGAPWLATFVGLLVALVGIVSSAAIANGFVGYARHFIDLPAGAIITILVVLLGAVAAWGITESVALAATVTLVEIAGLLLVIVVGVGGDTDAVIIPSEAVPLDWVVVSGVLAGAILAFYAFLGFEDMVNLAEEVRDAPRVMPQAIIITLAITGVLYVAVATIAVRVVPLDLLAGAEAPLALVYRHATGGSANMISAIGAVAVINGALIQIIMASRVLYGLSNQGWLPRLFAWLHPRTRTPVVATAFVSVLVLALALALTLVRLAELTSTITLIIFALVNLALMRVKARTAPPAGIQIIPYWVPAVGFVVSSSFAVYQLSRYIL